MYCVNGILFNHELTTRRKLVTMKIINGIKSIIMKHKNLLNWAIFTQNDWGHVKDYVYGMWLMMQQNGTKGLCIVNR